MELDFPPLSAQKVKHFFVNHPKFIYRHIFECGMPSHFVVPDFDVLKNFEFELVRCPEVVSVNQFTFQALEKALCHSVIPTITFARHALYHAFIQRVAELLRCILHSAIRVKDHSGLGSSVANGHSVSPDGGVGGGQ